MENDALWQEVMEELKLSIEPNALKTWFKHARIHNIDKSEMVIYATNEFAADWMRKHFLQEVKSAVKKVLPTIDKVKISYEDNSQE